MRRSNPIRIVACLLALLSLQLGQDIFVSKPQGGKSEKEVRQMCFSSRKTRFLDSFKLVFALFFCLKPELLEATGVSLIA